MSEEEMKALVEMKDMLKAKLEQQTKVYQQSLQEMQNEVDDLQRNCDVFNEQTNDAVEETVKLKQDKQELIEWLEGKINRISGTTSHTYTDSLGKTVVVNRLIQGAYEEVLEKLGE